MPVSEHAVHYLEIVTPDPEAASRHYGTAFGWKFEAMQPELGNAFVATLPDGTLCGIRAPMHPTETPTVRTYVRVTDLEAAVQAAVKLGGEIALEATEIPGRGRIAIYLYGGIQQGLWQLP
jgi:predicted enzyme related to lactoylglutathione lyase